ncbi:MAG: hypothetical protein ACON3Z_14350 [Bradymonadia bacterium]
MRIVWSSLIVFSLSSAAWATTVIALSVEKMAQESTAIVRATVESTESHWGPKRARIFTHTKIRVLATLKGEVKEGESITISQVGGEVGGLVQHVAGNAKLAVGEEIVVFLERHPTTEAHLIMGMAQGKFSVNRNTTPPTIQRNIAGLHRITTKPKHDVVTLARPIQSGAEKATLAQFKARIINALPANSTR